MIGFILFFLCVACLYLTIKNRQRRVEFENEYLRMREQDIKYVTQVQEGLHAAIRDAVNGNLLNDGQAREIKARVEKFLPKSNLNQEAFLERIRAMSLDEFKLYVQHQINNANLHLHDFGKLKPVAVTKQHFATVLEGDQKYVAVQVGDFPPVKITNENEHRFVGVEEPFIVFEDKDGVQYFRGEQWDGEAFWQEKLKLEQISERHFLDLKYKALGKQKDSRHSGQKTPLSENANQLRALGDAYIHPDTLRAVIAHEAAGVTVTPPATEKPATAPATEQSGGAETAIEMLIEVYPDFGAIKEKKEKQND